MELFLKIILQVLAVAIALLVNLLDYVTHDKRTWRFKRNRWLLFALSIVFLLASTALVIVDDQRSRAERHALEVQVERARQPVRDVYVSYRVDFPMKHPALEPFVGRINAALEESAKAHEPRQGLSTSRTRPDGSVISMNIPADTNLFPGRDRDPLPYFLLNYTALQLDFYASGNHEYTNSRKSDLMFSVETVIDNSVSVFRENPDAMSSLHIDLERGVMFVEAGNWRVPPQRSRFTGRIQSVPELLEATLVVRYQSFASSNHEPVVKYLTALQREVAVEYVEVNVAGRHLRFSRNELTAYRDASGAPYYIAPVAKATDPGA